MDYDLRKLQSIILYIAKEIKRVCDKNAIDYTMIGGTLIGAVRHKGVIPWDDDMDFVMTRHNYERFLEACEVDLQEQFEVVNWRSNSNYGNGFTKIMLKGTEAIEEGKENVQYPHCIFVDVFPFDNIPDSRLKQLYQKWKTYFCIRMIQQKEGSTRKYNSTKKKMAYSILKCLSHGFSADFLIRVCEKEMSRYKNCQTNQMTSMTGYYGYEKEKIEKGLFQEYIELPFEDTTFKAIKEYVRYLSQVFGNYMELPPVEKRRSHGLVYVDFGKY